MKNRRNYYRMLHIQPDAPLDIIKASYRTQMQKLKMHPDLGGDEWDASVLNEAYSILSDPEKRATYDASFLGNRDGLVNNAQTPGDRAAGAGKARQTATAHDHDPVDMSVCAFCRTRRPADMALASMPFCTGCGGPLTVANTLRIVDTSGRACARMPHHAPVTAYTDTDCPGLHGRLHDLSPMGLQLHLPSPLRSGQIIRINADPVAAIARVIFCNRTGQIGQFNAGVAFITVSFRQQAGTFLSENA